MSEFCVIGSGISGATIANLLNKRNSVIVEMSSSKIFDSSLKLGYQFNF